MITLLSKLISDMGAEEFADRFGVSVRASKSWQYGERLPRARQAQRLVDKSNGTLSLTMIYQPVVGANGSEIIDEIQKAA